MHRNIEPLIPFTCIAYLRKQSHFIQIKHTLLIISLNINSDQEIHYFIFKRKKKRKEFVSHIRNKLIHFSPK